MTIRINKEMRIIREKYVVMFLQTHGNVFVDTCFTIFETA